jgi:hypothetical protein
MINLNTKYMQKQKITIIGNGQFGKFIKPHLEKHFEVEIYDKEYL